MIGGNITFATILKTIKLKNMIKFWRQKFFEQTKFILVLIAKVSCAIGCDSFLRGLIYNLLTKSIQSHTAS